MPRGHIVRDPVVDAQRLQGILTQEWMHPSETTEPVLIEEPTGSGDYKRLYVVWSQWNGLSHRQRAEVILRAYRNAHTEEQLMDVTIATGLTPAEAANMNLRYELE